MDERKMQFWVGLMVLAALGAGLFVVWAIKGLPESFSFRSYALRIRFDTAPGVTQGTPVRKSGIRIGEVESVQLVDGDKDVMVTVRIQRDKKIYKDEDCYVTQNFLGDTALSFIPTLPRPAVRELIAPNTEIQGQISEDPTGLKRAMSGPIRTVNDTGEALREASVELKAAARNVNRILNAEKGQIHNVLHNAADALGAISNILGDRETQHRLSLAMKDMPATLDTMNRTFQAAQDSIETFTKRSPPDNKTAVERMVSTINMTERTLRKFSMESEDGRPAPADQIAAAMQDIGTITSLMRQIMSRIDQGEGSFGALLNDRQLYDRLNRAARNIEQVSRELKPIVDDARVFTDKIARHPGVIVRDAVKPGVGIK